MPSPTAERTTRGVLFDIMVARTSQQDARDLRSVLEICQQTRAIPDWPDGGTSVDRQHAFDAALVDLISSGVAEQIGHRYAPVDVHPHVKLREYAGTVGPDGFTEDDVIYLFDDDREKTTLALALARECGALVRREEGGRHYGRNYAAAA